MKFKNILKVLFIFFVLLLVGCSQQEKKVNNQDRNSIGFYQSIKEKNQSIWYQSTGKSKDDVIQMVLIFKGNEVIPYDLADAENLGYDAIRLKELSQLSDKEIVSKVVDLNDKIVSKKLFSQYFAQDENIKYYEDQIAARQNNTNGDDQTLSEMKQGLEQTKILKEKLGKIKPNELKADNGSSSPYMLTLKTDNTGNHVTAFDLDFIQYRLSLDPKSKEINEVNPMSINLSNPSTFDILNKHFSSFSINKSDNQVLFTRISNLDKKIILDKSDIKGSNIAVK